MRATVCLIQPPNYVHSLALLEVCQLLCFSLQSLGWRPALQVNRLDPGAVNIVVGYHLLQPQHAAQLAGPVSVFYQLEQLSSQQGWFTPEREAVLRTASAVWDYSPANAAFLEQRGFPSVGVLPLGYHSIPGSRTKPHDASSARHINHLGSLSPWDSVPRWAHLRAHWAHFWAHLRGPATGLRDRVVERPLRLQPGVPPLPQNPPSWRSCGACCALTALSVGNHQRETQTVLLRVKRGRALAHRR